MEFVGPEMQSASKIPEHSIVPLRGNDWWIKK